VKFDLHSPVLVCSISFCPLRTTLTNKHRTLIRVCYKCLPEIRLSNGNTTLSKLIEATSGEFWLEQILILYPIGPTNKRLVVSGSLEGTDGPSANLPLRTSAAYCGLVLGGIPFASPRFGFTLAGPLSSSSARGPCQPGSSSGAVPLSSRLGCGLTAASSTPPTRPCTVPLKQGAALGPHLGLTLSDLCDGCPLLGGLFCSLCWRCRAPRVGHGSNGDLGMLLAKQVPVLWVKAHLSAWHHRAGFVGQCCSGCCSIYVGRLVGPRPGAFAVAASLA
jgi:hypothetical protein